VVFANKRKLLLAALTIIGRIVGSGVSVVPFSFFLACNDYGDEDTHSPGKSSLGVVGWI